VKPVTLLIAQIANPITVEGCHCIGCDDLAGQWIDLLYRWKQK
jgi:hypothetical protein